MCDRNGNNLTKTCIEHRKIDCIDAAGLQSGMSQKILYVANIHANAQQMAGEEWPSKMKGKFR